MNLDTRQKVLLFSLGLSRKPTLVLSMEKQSAARKSIIPIRGQEAIRKGNERRQAVILGPVKIHGQPVLDHFTPRTGAPLGTDGAFGWRHWLLCLLVMGAATHHRNSLVRRAPVGFSPASNSCQDPCTVHTYTTLHVLKEVISRNKAPLKGNRTFLK